MKAVVSRYRNHYFEALEFLKALRDIPNLPVRFCYRAESLYNQVAYLASIGRSQQIKYSPYVAVEMGPQPNI